MHGQPPKGESGPVPPGSQRACSPRLPAGSFPRSSERACAPPAPSGSVPPWLPAVPSPPWLPGGSVPSWLPAGPFPRSSKRFRSPLALSGSVTRVRMRRALSRPAPAPIGVRTGPRSSAVGRGHRPLRADGKAGLFNPSSQRDAGLRPACSLSLRRAANILLRADPKRRHPHRGWSPGRRRVSLAGPSPRPESPLPRPASPP